MKRLSNMLFAVVCVICSNVVSATPLTGEVRFLDPSANLVLSLPITGDLDTTSNTMLVDPFLFFGFQWVTRSVELLGEGMHTRPDGAGGEISVTVGPGQVGAYMVFEWNVSTIPNFMVWDVNSTADGARYTVVDSDGDGIAGQAFVVNPFPGFSVVYDFTVGEPPPAVNVSVNVQGGPVQECTQTGASVVSLSASTELTGGAELGSVEWFVDGESVGTGMTIAPLISLGVHTVEALASTTTGETDMDSLAVEVRDTNPPVLEVGFLDRAGEQVTAINSGDRVTAHIVATDVCDPEPAAEGTAVPVFAVSDGDPIKIRKGRVATLKLPTTAVELSATARDASGNSSTGMAVLSIIE